MQRVLWTSANPPYQAKGFPGSWRMKEPLLCVDNLTTRFTTSSGTVLAVDRVSFSISRGEVLGIVGESGSGKSQIFMSIAGLLPPNGQVSGEARFLGRNLIGADESELNRIRGRALAFVFQDPMTALHPFRTIASQLTEMLRLHRGLDHGAARAEALRLLDRVHIPDAKRRLDMYPHELSGGMRQRVMIAMSISCNPRLLIADEPTTALDVTVQLQVLDLLDELRRDEGIAIALITHDMGVVSRLSDRVIVIYAGNIVEEGTTEEVLLSPTHPYTQGLLASMPDLYRPLSALSPIPGYPPDGRQARKGCMFAPRCSRAQNVCRDVFPELTARTGRQRQACHFPISGSQGLAS